MSHFTKMKTRLVVKKHIVEALQDLGYEPREGKVSIRGYDGQKTEVNLMIPTKNPIYDLGFRKAGDAFELVADWYGIEDVGPEKFLNKVQQKYAYHAVVDRMAEQGFEVVEEENRKDNTIHLTVRRTAF
ncbi:DUF1257 domain-containing protein [bacterium]|nr:DUF1257 domain-containing protein [bacterium]